MLKAQVQYNSLESFSLANSLLQNAPGSTSASSQSFNDILDKEIKEVAQKAKDETISIGNQTTTKKKKETSNLKGGLPDISSLMKAQEKASHEIKNTYELLERFREEKKLQQDEDKSSLRQQVLSNSHNVVGQPLIQPVYDQNQRKMSRANMLDAWERLAPQVTEDGMKKSVRIDIPLLNDVQALVLKINPDRSITASLLGSKEMGELIQKNKDQLDRSLRHHRLTLKEFNTYKSELEFNSESGTKKGKKKHSSIKKHSVDLV